ncbi:hypothetical protein GGR50DRAFT_702111 [Xylaria sp. CBS 124048]|nr:hypothetical protein GGR50DRAFT_702111 [Xylaria sp. CBS 124048]
MATAYLPWGCVHAPLTRMGRCGVFLIFRFTLGTSTLALIITNKPDGIWMPIQYRAFGLRAFEPSIAETYTAKQRATSPTRACATGWGICGVRSVRVRRGVKDDMGESTSVATMADLSVSSTRHRQHIHRETCYALGISGTTDAAGKKGAVHPLIHHQGSPAACCPKILSEPGERGEKYPLHLRYTFGYSPRFRRSMGMAHMSPPSLQAAPVKLDRCRSHPVTVTTTADSAAAVTII